MYEVFEHTADLGLRIRASDRNALFEEAGRALFSIIVDNLEDVRPTQSRTFQLAGTDGVYLLFDWLNELLYTFETEHLLLAEFIVQVDETGLQATCRGEPADPDRHHLSHEVKAITYHALKCEQTREGWLAEIIVDI